MGTRISRVASIAGVLCVIASLGSWAEARVTPAGDLVIPKREVTPTATFYRYRLGNLPMEVLALRAADGTVRTAFNTCQVCYASGRGYYVPQGEYLVCQNCGNRFRASQVELVKGGCNPMPIGKDRKLEDGETITIRKAAFEEARPYFLKWKR